MVELRGRLHRTGWLGWIARLIGRDPRGLGGYTIDWDERVILIEDQRVPLTAVTGVWLTNSGDGENWGTVSLTIPGRELNGLCSLPFAKAEAFAIAVAERCGCPLHRTN